MKSMECHQVNFHVRFGVQDEPLDLPTGLVHRSKRAAEEVLSIREAQGCVVSVDDQAGQRRCVWIVIDVMHAGQAGNESEDAVMRMRDAAQQIQD
ncbi:hypothetical protein MAUB1S_04744 [Mycolicibacterium aubagnense]